jgi:hypothetical protein
VASCALLLVSAGTATVPGGDDGVPAVRDFYARHAGVVVAAQVLGLAAAAALVPLVLGLADMLRGRRAVVAAGLAVVGAAVVTAVPVLVLCRVAGRASPRLVSGLAVASDLVDVLLFAAVAAFAGVVAALSTATLLRVLAAVVAVLSAARAVFLLAGSAWLDVLAPVGFLVLVLVLSVRLLREGPVVRPGRPVP